MRLLILKPTIMVLSYVAMRRMGLPLPATPCIALLAGIGEGVGWSGYAIDRL